MPLVVIWRREQRQVDQLEICCNSPGMKCGGLVQVLAVRTWEGHLQVWPEAVSQLRSKSHPKEGNSVVYTDVEHAPSI